MASIRIPQTRDARLRPQGESIRPIASLAQVHPATTREASCPQKWRDLIRQGWHSDPLECPVCQKEMRLISVIEDPSVIEKILRHHKLWCGPAPFAPARPPPSAELREPEPEVLVESDPRPDDDDVITD